MKLIKCYVASFGKLKDFSFDFVSGLNTIKEDNGWGKSTLSIFIKSMFYGLNSGKRSVSENERIKYRPWNSTDRFGGFIQFEWGGNEYKIERFFGSKEADDVIKLFDVKTGREYTNTENLGKRIFEIDEEGFLSTTFFSQKDFQVKSNTSITAKFNSVCEVQDSDAFDKAIAKVEEKAKTFKYRGDKGLIPDLKREIFYNEQEIERAVKSVDAIKILKTDVQSLENKVEHIKKQANLLTEQVAEAGKAEAVAVKKARYTELVQTKNNLLSDKKTLEVALNGNFNCKDELNEIKKDYETLNNIDSTSRVIQSDISQIENDYKNVPKKSTNKSWIGFGIGAVAFLICWLVVVWQLGALSPLSIIALSLTVICAVASMFCLFTGKTKINTNQTIIELLKKKQSELNDYTTKRNLLQRKIHEFVNRFNIEEIGVKETLDCIENCLDKYTDIVKEIENINLQVCKFDISEFEQVNTIQNIEELKRNLANLQAEYVVQSGNLANKKASVKIQEEFASSVSDLMGKGDELKAKLVQYNQDYEILNLTADFLKEADENLKVKYREPLQESLNKYLSYIEKKSSAVIDVDLSVSVLEKDGQKVTDYYSKGYQNLFEICKRFALTDVLFTGEKPFIILDDPFYNLDDDKVQSALELIKNLSEEYQIIYFVCHESRRV